ncbi:uncharacterized protein A4U43_C08F21380 [Asparagus officinalis]|nr:uncharacterized protein A4U43_C08F21380 [Asparagus officinalis]
MSSSKFLGFIVTTNKIHIDPNKVKAIQELQPPRNLKELRGLQGRLAYIRRFISNLSDKCQPFSKPMKKGVCFVWDELCQQVFDEIKIYLSNPPVLVAAVLGKPFLINIRAMEHSLGALLAQNDDVGHEQGIYYLRVGMVLVSPQNHVLFRAFSLTEPCTNNMAEYNALLIGLDFTKELGASHLEAYSDSQLIVRQMTGEYEVRNDDLIPCHKVAIKLVESFESFYIEHVLHSKNTHADALASLAANLAQPLGTSQ